MIARVLALFVTTWNPRATERHGQTIMTSNTQKRTARRRRELDMDRDAGRRLAAIAAGRSLNAQRTDCAVAKADRFGPSPRFAYLTRTYD